MSNRPVWLGNLPGKQVKTGFLVEVFVTLPAVVFLSSMIYKEFPFLKIEVDEPAGTLIMTWQDKFTSAEYREATRVCVEAIKTFKIRNWLADTRNIDEIKVSDQEWTNENILYPISDLGVKKVAIIIPENVNNHLAISSIMVKGRSYFRFDSRYFVYKKEAFDWFNQA